MGSQIQVGRGQAGPQAVCPDPPARGLPPPALSRGPQAGRASWLTRNPAINWSQRGALRFPSEPSGWQSRRGENSHISLPSPFLSVCLSPLSPVLHPNSPTDGYSLSLGLSVPIWKSGLITELGRPLNEFIQVKCLEQGLAHSPVPSQWPRSSSCAHGRVSHSLARQ